jgi:hypothetical protein
VRTCASTASACPSTRILWSEHRKSRGPRPRYEPYIRQEARELARKLGISYCDALDMIYKAARAAGNSKKANDTKATQKQDGCRGH